MTYFTVIYNFCIRNILGAGINNLTSAALQDKLGIDYASKIRRLQWAILAEWMRTGFLIIRLVCVER